MTEAAMSAGGAALGARATKITPITVVDATTIETAAVTSKIIRQCVRADPIRMVISGLLA
jgi:hypothetical protein